MLKKIALGLGITSVAALAVYTVKVHMDVLEIKGLVYELAETLEQEVFDERFEEITEHFEDD